MTDKRISNKTSGVNARKSSSTTNSTKKGGIKKEREPRKPRAARKPRNRSGKRIDTLKANHKAQPRTSATPIPKRDIDDGPRSYIQKKVINAGGPIRLDELRSESPVPLGCLKKQRVQRENAALLIKTLHPDDPFLFCGDLYNGKENIRRRSTWESCLESKDQALWIPNSLTGKLGLKKDGEQSYRCEDSILTYEYLLYKCWYWSVPLQAQAAFLKAKINDGWDIRAIIDSGDQSLHALLRVNCRNQEEWDSYVKKDHKRKLEPWGADKDCFSACSLSRLPGHINEDTGKLQSLVWLASNSDQKNTGREEAR
jgi:hypothetical protein